MRHALPALLLLSALCAVCSAASGADADAVLLNAGTYQLRLGADGTPAALVSPASGNVLDPASRAPFLSARIGGTDTPATAVSGDGGRITARFGADGPEAVVDAVPFGGGLVFTVLSADARIEALTFLNLATTLSGTLEDPFVVALLARNLQTKVEGIPGPMKTLKAECFSRFGIAGASAALVGGPPDRLRGTLKDALADAKDLPQPPPGVTPVGGPWALDAEVARGSYLFDFGALTEETADEWIELAKTLGLTQIDFHTGTSMRFGDLLPNPKLFPRGRDSVRAALDKLHAAGIAAGLHTYAFFMAKDTPWVTPVPDPRLGSFRAFTLAADVSATADTIPVAESTADVSLITDFFVRNSVTLRIGEELVTFTGVTKEAPFAFTGCTRGALGTKAAAHAAGEQAHHLKECFGLFAPDADSTLLAEVAAATADTYNECGFDMIYLDALDGEDILGGRENGWHYGALFAHEIAKRLQKPALFEMSTFHHHLWCIRARMGAWDHPARSYKRFIDVHVAANRGGAGSFLPMTLGWWAVKTWQDDPQVEPTLPDDIEYLMCKALGNDMGIALMGIDPKTIKTTPAFQVLAPIFRDYEALRLARRVPDTVRARLREPGAEFTLQGGSGGDFRFLPVHRARHKVGTTPEDTAWTVANPHAAQPARIRIQPLHGAAAGDAAETQVLESFADLSVFKTETAAPEVTVRVEPAGETTADGAPAVRITAANGMAAPEKAWAKVGRRFDPVLNIKDKFAIGLWVHGDGSGALLNVQFRSPEHTVHNGTGDHYVRLDFNGWRRFTLVEPEGGAVQDHPWPYSANYYYVYREEVDHAQVASFSVWLTGLPAGREVSVMLSPVTVSKTAKQTLRNPAVTLGGATVTFPVELETGMWLECLAPDDCKVYGPEGGVLRSITPQGALPALAPGENPVRFTADTGDTPARALVTLSTVGNPLE